MVFFWSRRQCFPPWEERDSFIYLFGFLFSILFWSRSHCFLPGRSGFFLFFCLIFHFQFYFEAGGSVFLQGGVKFFLHFFFFFPFLILFWSRRQCFPPQRSGIFRFSVWLFIFSFILKQEAVFSSREYVEIFSFFCFIFYFQIYFEAGGSVFLLGGVEGEMDPGNFCSILQFMESAGVYRFLTQIPTCWITGKVVRWLSGAYLPDIFSVKIDITEEMLMEPAFIT